MTTIDPINHQQKKLVMETTVYYVRLAQKLYEQNFPDIPVQFSLTGKAAGMYHLNAGTRYIRYNPYIFAKYFDDNLNNTVPHEVAHYIADLIYGIRNIRPHGPEWKKIMHQFGVIANTRCNYNLDGIPHRSHRRFKYKCQCRTHELSTRRHNMVKNGKRQYYCTSCKTALSY